MSFGKTHLKEVFNDSSNLTDVLRAYELNSGSSNKAAVKKICVLWDMPLLFPNPKNTHSPFAKPRTNDEIFSQNSPVVRAVALRKIKKDNLLDYKKCAICGMDDTWNDEKLVLILDHMNGINNDHRLENMRFVCPNCNSQLDTFAGRNAKSKKEKPFSTCKFCGKKILYKSTTCSGCRWQVNLPDMLIIKDEIEHSTITSVAKKHGVSRSTLYGRLKKISFLV